MSVATTRKVKHEITLFALTRNTDGTRSVFDIVETDNHYASYFVRRWLKDPQIAAIGTRTPDNRELHIRNIR